MAEPIDEVYVEIGADTTPLDEGVKKSSEKANRKLKTEFEKASEAIDRALARTAKNVEKNLAKIAEDGTVSAAEVEAALTHAARAIEDEYQQMAKSVERSFAKVSAAAVESAVAGEAATGLAKSAGDLEGQLSGLGSTATKATGALAEMGPATLVLGGAIIFILPTVVALAAALAQLAGVVTILPAAVSTLVLAIAPLVIAFKNFGEAVSALASGDVKKIDEALKKLSPSARRVAREIGKMLPAWKNLQKIIQENFFNPLIGQFTILTKKTIPALRGGLGAVANAWGELAAKFVGVLTQPAVLKNINTLLYGTTAILRQFMDVGFTLFKGFTDAAVALQPEILKISKAIAGAGTAFGTWLSKVSKSGQLKKWFDDAKRVAGELWDLVSAIGSLIGTIFGNFTTDGEDVIKTLTDVTKKFDDFYKSADGQKALDNARILIKAFIALLEGTATVLTTVGHVVSTVVRAYKSFYSTLADLVSFISTTVWSALKATGAFFVWLGGKIVDGLSAAWNFVKEWGTKIGAWFASLPGIIWGAIQKIPGLVEQAFKNSIDQALFVLGAGTALIIAAFTKLPGMMMNALGVLRDDIVVFFNNLWLWIVQSAVKGWTWVVTTTQNVGAMIVAAVVNFWNSAVAFTRKSIQNIIDYIVALPGRIVLFTKAAGAAIGNFFANVFGQGKARAKSAIDNIVDFIRNLPSRLTGFVKNVGGDIANVIKDMLNYAIRKINDGIASVDKFVPGDLPRIPQLAKGAVVMPTRGGSVVNVAEAGQPEAILPLSELKRFFPGGPGEGGNAMTVSFGPGSITVEYHGAVPTESEATSMGAAIGHGIATTLEKRDVRTSVRRI